MKADTFMNAVGMVDERFLDIEIPQKGISRRWKKALISIASAAAVIACPLPALTACGVAPAYDMLYRIAPSVAQTFKPVQKTCEDKGIEMMVISAEKNGSEASFYLAMHDKDGVYPDGEWDLFDSYIINVPKDMWGTCSFSEYDAETDTTYFVVTVGTMDKSPISKGKVTFSVGEMLLGKEKTQGKVEGVDLNNIPYEPQTRTLNIDEFRGYSDTDLEKLSSMPLLINPGEAICTPAPGVSIMNVGYFDGGLHILMKYDDILHTDNHGWVHLTDKDGNSIGDDGETWEAYDYWDDTHTDSYCEQIIKVDYDKLGEYTMNGDFTTSKDFISGKWQVTFPLED